MSAAQKQTCAILLLKEDPKSDASHSGDVPDAYHDAMAPLLASNNTTTMTKVRLDYIAPLAPAYSQDTLLHSALLKPPLASNIWALVFTSQNGVKAFENCVQELHKDTDSQPLTDAWLALPVFSLSGMTLKAVERAGFRTVYGRDFTALDQAGRPILWARDRHPDDQPPTETASIGYGSQLADLLLALPCPSSSTSSSSSSTATTTASPPELWFLTGETHMSTLRDRFQKANRSLREIEVYRTDPQPGLEDKVASWITSVVASESCSSSTAVAIIWLVGFSPKGVDLVWPGLQRALASLSDKMEDGETQVLIQWAAIGQTTAARIQERIAQENEKNTGTSCPHRPKVLLSSTVAIATFPKPEHLAKAMSEHFS